MKSAKIYSDFCDLRENFSFTRFGYRNGCEAHDHQCNKVRSKFLYETQYFAHFFVIGLIIIRF